MIGILKKIIAIEKLRYKYIGYWFFFNIGLWVLFIKYFPIFIYNYWRYFDVDQNRVIAFFVLYSLKSISTIFIHSFYYFLYFYKIPFFEQYRINLDPWPWESNKDYSFLSTLKINFRNEIIVFGAQFLGRARYDLTDKIPDSMEILKTFFYFVTIFAVFFYICHRTMHVSYLYSRFHKKHHEYRIAVSNASTYSDLLDFIVGTMFPAIFSFMTYRKSSLHIIPLVMFMIYLNIESVNTHSGYSFPWNMLKIIPFSTPGFYHNYHHVKSHRNYGEITYLPDLLMGSSSNIWKEDYYKQKFIKTS